MGGKSLLFFLGDVARKQGALYAELHALSACVGGAAVQHVVEVTYQKLIGGEE